MTRQPNLLVAAILALAINSVAHAAPINTVFGNLGANGTDPLSPSTNAGISDSTWLMHGFTVTAPKKILQTVRLGLFDNDSTIARVQIFQDSSGLPSGSPLGTQTATVSSVTPSFQTFDFGNLPLAGGSSYWVVVSAPNASSLFNWAFNEDGNVPGTQNASGWTPLNPVTKISLNAGLSWATSNGNRPAAISITAVPEPSTYAMAAVGFAAAGLARWRRRMTRAGR